MIKNILLLILFDVTLFAIAVLDVRCINCSYTVFYAIARQHLHKPPTKLYKTRLLLIFAQVTQSSPCTCMHMKVHGLVNTEYSGIT